MTVATKEQLAAKLAQAIYEEIATPLFRARERASQVFRSLRITPVMTVDPARRARSASASPPGTRHRTSTRRSRSSSSSRRSCRRSAGRRACLVFDEFQEVLELDPEPAGADARRVPDPAGRRPRLPRQQAQHDARLFNDANEPFWRSAKQMELGVIAPRRTSPRSSASASRRPAAGSTRLPSTGVLAIDARPPVRDAGALLRAVGGDAGRRRAGGRRRARRGDRTRTPRRERALHADLGPGVARAAGRAPGARRRAARLGDERGVPQPPRPARAPRASSARSTRWSTTRSCSGRAAGAYRIGEPFLAEWILRLSG